jgi:hypothetical protein
MTDGRNLYFIRILQAAFEGRDRKAALKAAIENIVSMGRLPEYQGGFKSFRILMKALDEDAASDSELQQDIRYDHLEASITDIVTTTFDGSEEEKQTMMRLIHEAPELAAVLEEMCEGVTGLLFEPDALEIEVEREGLPFGLYRLERGFDRVVIPGIQPGEYAIKVSTEFLLWRGELRAKDILWHLACPESKLPAAAESKALRQEPTMTIDLLNGEVRLELFPSLESGTLILTFRRSHAV